MIFIMKVWFFLKELFKAVKIKKSFFIISILFIACTSSLNIVFLYGIKTLIDSLIKQDYSVIYTSLASIVLANIAIIIIKRYSSLFANKHYRDVKAAMKFGFFKKVNDIPQHQLSQYATGDLLVRYGEDMDNLVGFVFDEIISIISNLLNLVIAIAYISYYSPLLLLILAIVPVLMKLSNRWGEAQSQIYKKQQEAFSALNVRAKDIFDYLSNIQVFGAQRFFNDKFVTDDDILVRLSKKSIFYKILAWLTGVVGYQVVYIFFYVGGGFLAFYGYISVGLIVSLFIIIDPLISQIQSLPKFLMSVKSTNVNLKRYNEIMEIECPKAEAEIIESQEYQIEFVDVSYSYEQNRVKALDNINLAFSSKDKVAIIGKSGSGKSTLFKILLGYDNHYTGTVKINGTPINHLELNQIKKIFSYIPQEFILLNRSIKNNIDLFQENSYTDDDVDFYAKLTQVDKDINEMEAGYETIIKEGGENISSGQKQRIGLLSVLLKKKSILLADECFSAVKNDMAYEILRNIINHRSGGLVLVSHSTIEDAIDCFDKIIIMEQGKIVLSGTPEDIKNTSIYQNLISVEV